MKVLSWNVLSKNAPQMPVRGNENVMADATVATRAAGLERLIAGENPDLIGFQELSPPWRDWLRDHPVSGYGMVGGHTEKTGEAGFIFYRSGRFLPLFSGVFWLADGAPETPTVGWDARFDRICTYALFEALPSGKRFLMLDTHLDHEGKAARPNQAQTVLSRIGALRERAEKEFGAADCPVILVGDMNSTPDSEVYRLYTERLCDARAAAAETLPADLCTSPGFHWCGSAADLSRRGHVIDYIFVSPNVRAERYGMICTATNLCPYGPFLSDHNAVWAQLSF